MKMETKEFKEKLSCIQNGPVYNNLRVVAVPCQDGEIHIEWFNQDKYNSHSSLFTILNEFNDIDYSKLDKWGTNNRKGIFGAFYALLGNNSSIPKLVIYGSSSDYNIQNIQPIGLAQYHKAFQKYALDNGFDLIWMLLE